MNQLDKIELSDIELFSKPQALRLWDVFALGPFMIYTGYASKNLAGLIRLGMISAGILTILYNGRNYILNEKRRQELIK